MTTYRYKFQLVDKGFGHRSGPAIVDPGGVVYVAAAGNTAKAAISDKSTSLPNPLPLTRGGAEFYTTAEKVDLFIQSPSGHFVTLWNVGPSELHEVAVDRYNPFQVMVIPVDVVNQAGNATETDTGFDFQVGDLVLPHPAIRVVTADPTETIDVGLLQSETNGDADGFLDDISVGTVGLFQGLILNGANTMGALFERQDSPNSGDLVPAAHAVTGTNATSVSYTLSTGSDTARLYIYLPYLKLPFQKPTLTP
jgi:hypothetical protein